jgi:CTP synthase (UTP-ammonia lyase)
MNQNTKFVKIALVGDHSPDVRAHGAIPKALALATDAGWTVAETWISTAALGGGRADQLKNFDAVWCVPGSPYASMDGALNAIRFARENRIPFLGTCGGCQHALIEICRNVLGLGEADHAESNPQATLPLIAPLPCALREVEAHIRLAPGSRARAIYGREEITEAYNCGFGLNPEHQHVFRDSMLHITGTGDDGSARVIELEGHPFFVATLFQPEGSAFRDVRHPLIAAFLQAATP